MSLNVLKSLKRALKAPTSHLNISDRIQLRYQLELRVFLTENPKQPVRDYL